MLEAEVIAQWIGIFIGIASGIGALVLGILNYIRDNVHIEVVLKLDMKPFGPVPQVYGNYCGMVRIWNVGRRPAYINCVILEIPNQVTYLVPESLKGERLEEGGQPLTYILNSESMEELANEWNKVRAVVQIGGTKFYSNYVTEKPSWIHEAKK